MKIRDIERLFPNKIRERGRKIYRDQMTVLLELSTDDCVIEVESSDGETFYEVEVALSEGSPTGVKCGCPYALRGTACKHMWAAILHYMEEVKDTLPQEEVEVRQWETSLLDAPVVTSAAEPPPANSNIQLTYVIPLSRKKRDDTVPLTIYFSPRLKSGEFGVLQPQKLQRWGGRQKPPEPHREILDELNSRIHYTHSLAENEIDLPRIVCHVIFQIAETGRLFWYENNRRPAVAELHPLQSSRGPWLPEITFTANEKEQQWEVSGSLVDQTASNSDETPRTIALEDLKICLSDGFAITESDVIQIAQTAGFSWIEALRRSGTLKIPFDDRSRFAQLIQKKPHLADVGLPEELMKIATDKLPCTPRIRFLGEKTLPSHYHQMSFVFGSLQFDYEFATVAKDDQVNLLATDEEGTQFCHRNREQETLHWNEIKNLGAEPVLQQIPGVEAHLKVSEKAFANFVRDATDQGWLVEAEDAPFRVASSFSMSVSSEIDWFDLKTDLSFGEVSASLPALLRALKNKENFVELSDGSRGLLPEDWLHRYVRLADVGEVEGDTIRFRPSQAMLLDAMLEEQENTTVDRDFSSFCRRLKKFEGISPAKPGRAFKGELRPYQMEGLGWMKFLQDFKLGGCLADDMGLGKTIQVLALLDQRRGRRLKKDEVRKRSLVVVPKSLVFNWMEEASKFTPKLKLLNFTGTDRAARWDESADDCHVVLTTFATMRNEIEHLRQIDFDYAILDEAQAIKNEGSLTAKASRLIVADHRLAMTGTPVENHLGELWSLFEFLNPRMLGASATFKRLMSGMDDEATRVNSLRTLSAGLKPFMLRRTKQQVLTELPDKSEQVLFCQMEPKQKKAYDDLKAYYRGHLSERVEKLGLAKAKIHVLEALLRLRQAACHPALIDDKNAKLPSAKLDAVTDQLVQLSAEGHKALVFSQFTSLLGLLKERLDKESLTYEYLDGKTRKRQERVKRFQSDADCPIFLISLKAGGHGLNLTAADYVFILDPWWNPAVEAQAVDRAHRMGQTKHVFAYRLICKDTVEERIMEMQENKKQLAEAIISEDKGLLKELTADDIQLLLS